MLGFWISKLWVTSDTESTPWEKSSSNSCSSQQKPDTVMKSIASTPCHAPIIEGQEGECIGYGEYIIQGPWFCMIGKGNMDFCPTCMAQLLESSRKEDNKSSSNISAWTNRQPRTREKTSVGTTTTSV
jgi:hypothetical protein